MKNAVLMSVETSSSSRKEAILSVVGSILYNLQITSQEGLAEFTSLEMIPLSNLCIKRPFPLAAHDPCARGHLALQETPINVVPAEVLYAVLILDPFGRLLRRF